MDSNAVIKRSSPPSHEDTTFFRGVVRLLALLVFWAMVFHWVMIPTLTYRLKWQPKIRAKYSHSTYFGQQGTGLLIFTFPVLFIALLGCVYVHLGKKLNDYKMESKDKPSRFATWKQPMLVKGPLGIVSSIELIFFTMFIAILVWSLSVFMYNALPKITVQSAAKNHHKVWEEKMELASLLIGLVGNICLCLLFFPVARGSSILPLFGLTSENSIKYHIWIGHIMMVIFTAHGIIFVTFFALKDEISELGKWAKVGAISNLAGVLSLLSGFVLWVTTIPRIRRKMFELFFYTHYLYIPFVIFFVFHAGVAFAVSMLPGFFLFLVDRFLRFFQSKQRARLVSARVLPSESLEHNFAKTPGLKYHPTSVMFINVPSISKLQWHPFTVSSNSNLEQDKISVIIKGEGSWSKKLHQVLSSPIPSNRLEVAVEGPYGPATTNFIRHDTLVMVSGGSGITPFFSIIRELIFMSETFKCKLPKVFLICAFKSSSDLTMLDLLLPMSSTTPYGMSNLDIQIEAYVTREAEPKTENSETLRAIWFKPPPTDVPISSILGKNHWLWLGMVIASSFGMFLILIGIITRYYIYPIDHGSNKIFSSPLRGFLNMLVICVSIAATSSSVVLWNKRVNAREANQIQSIEGSSPTGSPTSMTDNADKELESLPQQSLAQSTNVHYGERPDLKRILFEFKGSVGVLVSGPKRMRHEAATICSSGLAENIHFESMSFSW